MEHKTHHISICSQKGGIGKSTFTVLVASLLQFRYGRRVLVIDADFPQWSIFSQRRRELELLDQSKNYKLMMIRQFKATGQKIWPIVECRTDTAQEAVSRFLEKSDDEYDYVLYDLPGTIATKGVLSLVASLEHLFVPMRADKMVMESTMTFARTVSETLVPSDRFTTRGVHLFWSMIDKRERTPLYDQYDAVLASFGLRTLDVHIPARSRFSRELQADNGPVYRSTLFAPDRGFTQECRLDALCREIMDIAEKQ